MQLTHVAPPSEVLKIPNSPFIPIKPRCSLKKKEQLTVVGNCAIRRQVADRGVLMKLIKRTRRTTQNTLCLFTQPDTEFWAEMLIKITAFLALCLPNGKKWGLHNKYTKKSMGNTQILTFKNIKTRFLLQGI